MKDIFITGFCYRDLGLSPRETILTAKAQGFQGVELLSPITPEIAQILKAENMKIRDTTSMPDFENAAEMDMLHDLGVSYIQCDVRFGNREQVLRAAELMDAQGRIAARHGFKLYYHNHTHEWRQTEGGTLLDILLDHTDPDHVCLQMDAGWAICAGIDPEDFMRRHRGRVELLHIKACTKKLGAEGVPFIIPGPEEEVQIRIQPPVKSGGDVPAFQPPKMPPNMEKTMQEIKAAIGPMKDCLWSYDSLMHTAEEQGCKVFILERDEFYLPDVKQVMAEDLAVLRKFW